MLGRRPHVTLRTPCSSGSASSAFADLGRLILPYLWPPGSPGLRLRVGLALAALVAAKLVNIGVPFFLKAVVDAVSQPSLAAIPLAALLAYGSARLGASAFARAARRRSSRGSAQRSGRSLAMRVYRHLFDLSLAYHLQRRTGELARAIERGVQSISFLLETGLFSLGRPCSSSCSSSASCSGATRSSSPLITFADRRRLRRLHDRDHELAHPFRREMNERDNEFSGQAVDGLINYEMVKAFANEGFEAGRLDKRARTPTRTPPSSRRSPCPSSTPARPRSSPSA